METKLRTLAVISTTSFSANLDEVELRSGRTTQRMRIEHPLAAGIIPFVDDNHILMVKQYRYAIREETLEIPAGKVDPGETSEQAARRELMEETGYEAEFINKMFSFYPAIGYSDEVIDIYEARGLQRISELVDEDEISDVQVVSVNDFLDKVSREEIRDSKTVLAACLLTGCLNRDA